MTSAGGRSSPSTVSTGHATTTATAPGTPTAAPGAAAPHAPPAGPPSEWRRAHRRVGDPGGSVASGDARNRDARPGPASASGTSHGHGAAPGGAWGQPGRSGFRGGPVRAVDRGTTAADVGRRGADRSTGPGADRSRVIRRTAEPSRDPADRARALAGSEPRPNPSMAAPLKRSDYMSSAGIRQPIGRPSAGWPWRRTAADRRGIVGRPGRDGARSGTRSGPGRRRRAARAAERTAPALATGRVDGPAPPQRRPGGGPGPRRRIGSRAEDPAARETVHARRADGDDAVGPGRPARRQRGRTGNIGAAAARRAGRHDPAWDRVPAVREAVRVRPARSRRSGRRRAGGPARRSASGTDPDRPRGTVHPGGRG